MTTIWSIRTLALLALTTVAAAIATGTAQARPDPGKPKEPPSIEKSGLVEAANPHRPSGPAEHVRIGGGAGTGSEAGAAATTSIVALPAADDAGLDWRSAGIGALGALGALAALGAAAGALGAHRRGSRVRGAV